MSSVLFGHGERMHGHVVISLPKRKLSSSFYKIYQSVPNNLVYSAECIFNHVVGYT